MAAALPPLSVWALDAARTLDERYLLLLLLDRCRMEAYHRALTGRQRLAWPRKKMDHGAREAALVRPLDMPALTAEDAAVLEAVAPLVRDFEPQLCHEQRPLGEAGAVLRYFTGLEELRLGGTVLRDLSFVEALPRLRVLQLSSGELEDLGPLAGCAALRELRLGLSGAGSPQFAPPLCWLDAGPLAALTELEVLSFSPNPAVLAGLRFPKLVSAVMYGVECVQADCALLPEMPALRHLELAGVQSLRGIGRFPELRSLKVTGPLRDFGDLPLLTKLDCLEVATEMGWPRRVEAVAALPELLWVRFKGEYPRNYWPLTGARRLRELELADCPVAALEAAAVNAVLPPWDEVFALPARRTLGRARMVMVERGGDRRALPGHLTGRHADCLAHPKRFLLEVCWMTRRLKQAADALMGEAGAVVVNSAPDERSTFHREARFAIETMAGAQRLPELLEVMRQELGWSPHREWQVHFYLNPRIRLTEMTEQQKRWLEQIKARSRQWEEDEDHRIWKARQLHTLKTQFKLRELEELGEQPEPEDFDAPALPLEEAGWPRELAAAGPAPAEPVEADEESNPDFELKPFDEQEQNGSDDGGDDEVAVAPPPEPPRDFAEDPYAHPLAEYYRAFFTMTEEGYFFHGGDNQATLIQLMRREPDEYYPEPPKEGGR